LLQYLLVALDEDSRKPEFARLKVPDIMGNDRTGLRGYRDFDYEVIPCV
jgi:hypothetical protein